MLLRIFTPLLIGSLLFSVAYASYFLISRKLERARKRREAELITNHTLTQVENIEDHQELIKFENSLRSKKQNDNLLLK